MAVIAILVIAIVVASAGIGLYVLRGSAEEEPLPPIEHETYSKYGFSIEYPKGMTITEEGLYDATATDTSGSVAGISYEPFELFTVSWVEKSTPSTREELENALDEPSKFADYEKTGALIETTKLGHEMLYQQYVYPEDPPDSLVFGVWYCDINEKMYHLGYRQATEQNILQIYERYLESFVCH